MVLTCLLYKRLYENLSTVKYPNHVISVCKRDTLNIKEIDVPKYMGAVKLTGSLIDLSKLERLSKL